MKMAVVGSTGFIGSKVVIEAAERGHAVTAFSRNPDPSGATSTITPVKLDILDLSAAREAFSGHDIVISCFNAGHRPKPGQDVFMDIIDGAVNLIRATKESGVNRLLFVGGAGALYVSPGVQLLDEVPDFARGKSVAPAFPKEFIDLTPPEFALWWDIVPDEAGSEHIRPLVHVLRFFVNDTSYDWSFLSPPVGLHPGKATGRYEIGDNKVVMEGHKYTGIAIADLATAIVDEAEHNRQNHRHWSAYTCTA